MSESHIIGTDSPITARPNEGRPEERITYSQKYGRLTHAEVLGKIRERRYEREVHSDGFLAISNFARECECGGCAVYSDNYICPRCGRQVE